MTWPTETKSGYFETLSCVLKSGSVRFHEMQALHVGFENKGSSKMDFDFLLKLEHIQAELFCLPLPSQEQAKF